MERGEWSGWLGALVAFGCGLCGALGASRVAYEALFPRFIWLGERATVLMAALLGAFVALVLWRWLVRRQGGAALAPFLPLLLPLFYLFSPVVEVAASRFLLFLALWLLLALLVRLWTARWWPLAGLLLLFAGGVYLLTLGQHVGRADTFEFQVTAPRLGIAHPTGYPLYLLLSKPFTWLPWGTVAARVNLATALYGLVAVLLLFLLLYRLGNRRFPALLGGLLFALSPTFWSQAVEAEVYTLHSLVVAAALLLMVAILQRDRLDTPLLFALASILGLGLANHLTTVLLFPAAVITVLLAVRRARWAREKWLALVPCLLAAFLLPLLLYLYLPLRWAAVNDEPMGLARFVDWVVGGRFQGALQLRAWLDDPARYGVVARLLLAEWQPAWLLVLALPGLVWLAHQQRAIAAILLLTWLAFVCYALNYYVPDLNVFLLPAQLILAVLWGLGLAAIWSLLHRRHGALPAVLVALLLATPLLVSAAGRWTRIDRSRPDARVTWAQGVLAQPLPDGAAILADSEKFPPLYYLQQAEGFRPDLDIVLLPDEAAYRAELGARLAAGQPVYLARFLPGLEAQYHLRSAGPLLEVGAAPLGAIPAGSTTATLDFGSLRLRGYDLEPEAAVDPQATAITFYWQAEEATAKPTYVYTRWSGSEGSGPTGASRGQHPAGNSYPTVAWTPGEVVADYHLLARPLVATPREFELQVGLAPPFTPAEQIEWQTITVLEVSPVATLDGAAPLRAVMEAHFLHGISSPEQVRPEQRFSVTVEGVSQSAVAGTLELLLLPADGALPEASCAVRLGAQGELVPALWTETLAAPAEVGQYRLWAVTHECVENSERATALCGWLQPAAGRCPLGELAVSGVALPPDATNFDDRIALLEIRPGQTTLQPGGILPVNITWQALAAMDEDYTVFVQIVDEQDRIVGQVDSWPVQGTYTTSQWRTGEIVRDPYAVQLSAELPPGNYRVLAGLYLLASGQRLQVLDENGAPIDDKLILPGLIVPDTSS